MENPTNKKRFPWGWLAAGCAVVVIGVVVLVVVVDLVAIPAYRTTIANQNPTSMPLVAPLVSSTSTPLTPPLTSSTSTPLTPPLVSSTSTSNSGSGNGTSLAGLPFQFSAIQNPAELSTQSLMDQMTTSLNLNTDSDFMAPKTYTGTASLDPSTSFTLGNGWCAKDATTLKQNLANIQYSLNINGTSIDLSQYPTLYFSDDQGDACTITGISITPASNISGSYHVVLTQKFLTSLSDGITSSPYPAGNVTFDFSIQFQVIPNSGSKS